MLEIGKINKLKIIQKTEKGIMLDGKEEGEIFLPKRDIPLDGIENDEIDVFLYRNAQRKIIATGIHPYVCAGEFEFLTVNESSEAGALLDWGISKDLFLPAREQKMRVKEDRTYLVYVYYDLNTKQIIATAKYERFLGLKDPNYEFNQEVDILVVKEVDLGYKIIINNSHWGLVYKNEVFERVDIGQRTKGYIKNVRDDGKIDVALQKQGYKVVDELSDRILRSLQDSNGFLPLTDKTESTEIYNLFNCSKKSFKKSIGNLYRKKLITIDENGINIVSED